MSMGSATRWLGRKARQYVYAAWAAVLFTIITIKVFFATDPTLVTALTGNYGALALGAMGLIAACIGINRLVPDPPPAPAYRGENSDGRV